MQKLLIFSMDNNYYAFDIKDVIEIIRSQKINSIPGSSREVLGVTDVRGKISTVLDLDYLLNLNCKEEKGYFIILNSESTKQYIFPVTEVLDIQEFSDEDILTATGQSLINTRYIEKFIKYQEKIIVVLKINALFDVKKDEEC